MTDTLATNTQPTPATPTQAQALQVQPAPMQPAPMQQAPAQHSAMQSPLSMSQPAQAPPTHPPEVQALLQQLDPIAAPAPIGIWPLAPGWWLIIALLTIALVTLIYQWLKFVQANAYRKHALRQLSTLRNFNGNDSQFLQCLSELLKQVMLTAYPNRRAYIAKAHGQSWLNELNQHCASELYTLPQCQALIDGVYQASITCKRNELCDISAQWIKQHRKTKASAVKSQTNESNTHEVSHA